jgi:signal transduction histidine kinase
MTQSEFEKFSIDLRKKIDVVYDNLDNILNWSVTQLKGISTIPTVIEPHALAAEVVELYDEMARSKSVQLRNEIPKGIFASADKDQIRLVFRNLISNALKFTASGHVRLSANAADNEVSITVEDTGMGIAESDIQKLFMKDALWSAQGTRNEKGLGLGLLLCKEFVEKNQGTLKVMSEQGMGTTIRFTLPIAKGNNARPEFSGDVKSFEAVSVSA